MLFGGFCFGVHVTLTRVTECASESGFLCSKNVMLGNTMKRNNLYLFAIKIFISAGNLEMLNE